MTGPQPIPPTPPEPHMFWRVMSSSPITAREVRLAALVALVWFGMDVVWFVLTLLGRM